MIKETYDYNEHNKCRAIYNFCGEDNTSKELKSILLKSQHQSNLSRKVLTFGILGAIENDKTENAMILLNHMEKQKILSHEFPLFRDIFNCSTEFQNFEIIKTLDEKYQLIEKFMMEDLGENISLLNDSYGLSACLHKNGELEFSGFMGGELSNVEMKSIQYNKNPILFNFTEFKKINIEMLNSFFLKDCDIHESIVKHVLVKNTYLNNNESSQYLFSNPKCKEIIKNSEELRLFINSKKDYDNNKKTVRSLLSAIDLEDQLKTNNVNIKNHKL